MKCLAFFDNGFASNVIESNKRDIRFIWDGFLLFVSPDITINDIKNGADLFDGRIVLYRELICWVKSLMVMMLEII